MKIYIFIIFCFSYLLSAVENQSKQPFSVVAYNLENLFDIDGYSLYEDYKPAFYGELELKNKLDAIVKVLRKIGGRSGPDILLLQEVEVDRTPNQQKSATDLLMQCLAREGLGPYNFSIGYNPEDNPENWPAVQCLTLSKFPIIKSRLLSLQKARPILETTLSIDGERFTIFNNHWKSGASSEAMEKIRYQNASVLRKRIDELLELDPFHDFIVGGDLNSHYNQSILYAPQMRSSGINDILLSSNIEPIKPSPINTLYNLWHELPPGQRGSDAWRGKWGTLMHILLPVGLYDNRGIRYVNDSFGVARLAGLNMTKAGDLPLKWSNELHGFGASDHFPIFAFFSTQDSPVKKNQCFSEIEKVARLVDFSQDLKFALNWSPHSLNPQNYGSIFQFSGTIQNKNPLTLKLDGHLLGIYSFNHKVRTKMNELRLGEELSGYGLLSRYRGRWQFIIEEEDWIK